MSYGYGGNTEAQVPVPDPCAERIHTLSQQVERLEGALRQIVRGEEEAPVGMSSPHQIALDALNAGEER